MFLEEQFKIAEKYKNKTRYRHMKFHFYAVLGKNEEEVFSLIKITRVMGITKDVLFEGMLQNYRFHVVQENNVTSDFSVVDFPLMNLHDILVVALIMKSVDVLKLQVTSKEDFMNSFGLLKVFIEGYFSSLALSDVELAKVMGKEVEFPQTILMTKANINKLQDG